MKNYFEGGEDIDIWFQKRKGKFTASTNYKLIGAPSTFSLYVEEKAIEQSVALWERPEMEEVKSLLWGKVYEEPAHNRYVKETGNTSFTYIGRENPIFFPDKDLPDESGGTPDCANILTAGNVDYGAEYKCPKSPANHFRRLDWKDQFDLKEGYIQCYTQIQNLIRVTGALGWDFISYDERQLSKAKQIKIIEVKPDLKFINNLEVKLHISIKEKYKVLSKRMGTEIKNRTEFQNFLRE